MNRDEFMSKLTALLADVSETEREEAIQYYNDYFDDAGAENENSVMESLGTPEELAKAIKAGIQDGGKSGAFTEYGFAEFERQKNEIMNPQHSTADGMSGDVGPEDDRAQKQAYESDSEHNNGQHADRRNQDGMNGQPGEPGKSGSGKMSGNTLLIAIIILVCTFPLWIGIVGGLFGVIVGLLGAAFGLTVAVLATAVGLVVSAVALLVSGIMTALTTPLAGLCLIGASLIVAGISLLFFFVGIMFFGKVIPMAVNGTIRLVRSLIDRIKGGNQE